MKGTGSPYDDTAIGGLHESRRDAPPKDSSTDYAVHWIPDRPSGALNCAYSEAWMARHDERGLWPPGFGRTGGNLRQREGAFAEAL